MSCSFIMDASLTIVLLGHTGVGKSASGNTILGKPVFRSEKSFDSITNEICEESGKVLNQTIKVIDTPGILDSVETVEQIEQFCKRLVRAGSPRLFLVVVKIDRFTKEQKHAVEEAIRIIGEEEWRNSYMLFTFGDDLNGKTLDDFIYERKDAPLTELIKRFAGRHLFNNKNGGQEQVRQLLLGRLNSTDTGPERRIILLGLPRDGKSASGNTILGSAHFSAGGGFAAVTKETASGSAAVEGRKVTVVDTPGFIQQNLTPTQLFEEILDAIQRADPGPHAFLIVVRIGQISETNIKLFQMLPKLFGKNSVHYTMILFTYGDLLEDQSIDDLIRTEDSLSRLVNMCDKRYCVFDNSQRINRQQVGILLDIVDDMVAAKAVNAEPEHFTAEMFHDVQSLTYFQHMLQMLDCCHGGSGYERIND